MLQALSSETQRKTRDTETKLAFPPIFLDTQERSLTLYIYHKTHFQFYFFTASFNVTFTSLGESEICSSISPKYIKFAVTYLIAVFTRLLLIQAARGGINVETERGAARTVSVLTLATVTQDDVGNYSCRPTEGRSATVTLVVEEGKSQPLTSFY